MARLSVERAKKTSVMVLRICDTRYCAKVGGVGICRSTGAMAIQESRQTRNGINLRSLSPRAYPANAGTLALCTVHAMHFPKEHVHQTT
ncbi:hypothetical protein IG631_12474 [Alternaria alternata]|nr:hypothetical protein IG631_12474 [Alternaria alternata]